MLAAPMGVAAALVIGVSATPAIAQPDPPQTASDARSQLDQAQREAEALTEQWHAATDAFTASQAEADTARAAIEPARVAAEQARADEDQLRQQIDIVALSTFESGRLDQFNALLVSDSPQHYLDQMSALESLSADHKAQLDELLARVAATRRAQADADDAVGRAQEAADAARRAADEIDARRRAAEIRITEVERLLRQLSPQQRAEHNGPDAGAPSGGFSGSGVGVRALQAAATKLGKAYRWGASGPNTFDCSGLTSWAFAQAGVSLPRSSSAQATVGKAVSWNELRPGDLVFYYTPVSHVGIYAGEGKMINAPQSGDVVKYQTVSRNAFSGARRL
ncbi:NlpC/P60 family protein [Pseudonocardia asaccharolytica]|uniref:Hydrolase Nlp/P60 n=1 Tax=Pseudonocardia asaccharolytica DSM 44247 = NBRC 16224 TaxID=1123024 RepID=A0A511CX83_9PSEU|nr:NlpC/P60 family protein [Pseudonocardia asaccharolytica]GEL17165.1 hydrolase Nlp/P60 [Pseudonocardia asaccharolytica DSM 44247 = NBRC 16224]